MRIVFDEGLHYRLRADVTFETGITGYFVRAEYYEIDLDGKTTALKGYAWNGASGPAIDDPSFILASLPHDLWYQAMGAGRISLEARPMIDAYMSMRLEVGAYEGHGPAPRDGWFYRKFRSIRAWYAEGAVRHFGEEYATRRTPPRTVTSR